jgi:hypothetical protein
MSLITQFLENGPTRYFQPRTQARSETDILNRLAVMVASVAFGLPVILWLGAWAEPVCFRDSISHFYYDPWLGPVFVGLLFFIGAFLIAYTGETFWESMWSNIAGVAAMGIAMFPTANSGCETVARFPSRIFAQVSPGQAPPVAPIEPSGFFELYGASDWHMIAAAVLFLYLGLYCLIVLKRVIPDRHMRNGALIDTKRRRNRLYSWCGVVILICGVLVAVGDVALGGAAKASWKALNITFYVEALALWAFGLAWFAKGRVFGPLNEVNSG